MVSPELETANAVSASLGIPAARHTDVFADGKVQVVEFDVPADAERNAVIGRSLRQAEIPADSKVAGLIRGTKMVVPRGEERIRAGDRVVVIGSPGGGARVEPGGLGPRASASTTSWSSAPGGWGRRSRASCSSGACASASSTPSASAWPRSPRCCRRCARSTPRRSTRSSSSASGSAAPGPAVYCLNDDAKNLYGAVLAKEHGLRLTIALVHDHDLGRGLRARRRRRHHQPAPGDGRGDGPLRPRSAHPPDRDARGRSLRDPRPRACARTPS